MPAARLPRWANRYPPRGFAPRSARRYTKPRGSPLLATGTTSAVPLRGVNFARRLGVSIESRLTFQATAARLTLIDAPVSSCSSRRTPERVEEKRKHRRVVLWQAGGWAMPRAVDWALLALLRAEGGGSRECKNGAGGLCSLGTCRARRSERGRVRQRRRCFPIRPTTPRSGRRCSAPVFGVGRRSSRRRSLR